MKNLLTYVRQVTHMSGMKGTKFKGEKPADCQKFSPQHACVAPAFDPHNPFLLATLIPLTQGCISLLHLDSMIRLSFTSKVRRRLSWRPLRRLLRGRIWCRRTERGWSMLAPQGLRFYIITGPLHIVHRHCHRHRD